MSGAVDEPNVIIPLASSYNERGVAGYTHTVTNSEDQRKINCIYEIAKNAATGKGTLTLSKRPGVTIYTPASGGTSWGSASQQDYLVTVFFVPNIGGGNPYDRAFPLVFNTLAGNIRSSIPTGLNTTILASAVFLPAHVDISLISSTNTVIVQLSRYDVYAVQRVFFNSTANLTVGTAWTEIVDADFTGISHIGKMEFLDGFAFILDHQNVIWNSDVNSIANWTATSFISKSIQFDLHIGLARLGTKLLAFGSNSVEIFYNAGNTVGSPLGRIPSLARNLGLVPTVRQTASLGTAGGTNYYATIGTNLYFVGKESGVSAREGGSTGSIGLYVFNGTDFTKVSPSYIDKILSEKAASLYSINTMGFMGQSAVAICFSSPSSATQNWLMYFPAWNEFFEWTSTIFSPVNSFGYHLGQVQPDRLFTFEETDNWQDNGTSFSSTTQFRLPTNGSSTKFLPMYGVDADTDTGGIANTLTVEISTSDPQTFSTLGTIDLSLDRKVAFEGGSFTRAWMRIGNTNSRPYRIHNFLARIE